jgi:hypothetical protein
VRQPLAEGKYVGAKCPIRAEHLQNSIRRIHLVEPFVLESQDADNPSINREGLTGDVETFPLRGLSIDQSLFRKYLRHRFRHAHCVTT